MHGPGLRCGRSSPSSGVRTAISYRDLPGIQRILFHYTLSRRHWAWRMQGGALALARRRPGTGEPAPQVIFASSMLDLPLYRVLRGPQEARVPAIVYFHENQLTYPLPEGVTRDLGYGWKNLTTALAADRVLFNSAYHRAEFMEAAAALLERLPHEVPQGLVEDVAARSRCWP